MVCLGNICRSPMADGLLRKKINDYQLDAFVDSAGTSSYHIGEAPDRRMQETAKNYNCPINDLRARQFVQSDFDEFDIIYAMDQSNFGNIESLARNSNDRSKIKLILNESNPGMNLEVPDPYFGGEEGFNAVYKMLDEATDVIIENIKNGR